MTHSQYQKILIEIAEAAKKCGRNPDEVKLVAVTKTVEWGQVQPLYHAGHRDFGENRVVDALNKQFVAPDDCRWHFIGTLQSNKVRKVLGKFALIHSVDSVALAKKISEVSQEMGKVTPILLQVNVSGEGTKHGLSREEWKQHFCEVIDLPGIKVEGLMTMAPETNDINVIRKTFSGLRNFRDELVKLCRHKIELKELSMGMSGDFKIAIEEGATIVRIGSALFGG